LIYIVAVTLSLLATPSGARGDDWHGNRGWHHHGWHHHRCCGNSLFFRFGLGFPRPYFPPVPYYRPYPVFPPYVPPPIVYPPNYGPLMSNGCRVYTARQSINGRIVQRLGTVCLQPNGTWRFVN
jgi:hypothetical protein